MENLQDQAALFIAGAMTASEREAFEVLLEYRDDLRAEIAGLQEASAAVALTRVLPVVAPPAGLKERLLGAVAALPPREAPEGLVVTDRSGRIEWVNPAFTAMCGYSLAELKGCKPGPMLQGRATDPLAVARIRLALRERRACRETLVNYHKDGSSYRADIWVSPVLGDDGEPQWFVARERLLPAV